MNHAYSAMALYARELHVWSIQDSVVCTPPHLLRSTSLVPARRSTLADASLDRLVNCEMTKPIREHDARAIDQCPCYQTVKSEVNGLNP